MKKLRSWWAGALLVAVIAALIGYAPELHSDESGDPAMGPEEATYEAIVTAIVGEEALDTPAGELLSQTLTVTVTDEAFEGADVTVLNESLVLTSQHHYEVGDALVIVGPPSLPLDSTFYAVEPVRRGPLLQLFVLFTVVVILVARGQGVRALLGMAFSFLVVFRFILPQLILGTDPILTAILGAMLIIPGTFFLSHGLNRKTATAILGTLLTLLITGLLAAFFVELSDLSGLSSEEAAFLKLDTGETLNFQGLLMAGILISLLGILDDVTVSQASIVHQLKSTRRTLRPLELYRRALAVGRDHIASLVNTLVLIYAGASIPILMLFFLAEQSAAEVLNYEFLAEEVVQTLVASIGLVLAVPITTLLACLDLNQKKRR